MANAARWMRLDLRGTPALRAAVAGFAHAQPPRAAPAVLWARTADAAFAFALVAPLKFAPGRPQRWRSWALAPLIATYRQFGLRAYLDADHVCLSGQRIATSDARAIGACAVVVASFLSGECNFMESFRSRIEAQHGWQFDNSWPTDAENDAIAEALAGEPANAQ